MKREFILNVTYCHKSSYNEWIVSTVLSVLKNIAGFGVRAPNTLEYLIMFTHFLVGILSLMFLT